MHNNNPGRARKFLAELAWLVGIFLLVFGARSSLADHYVVPTGSMEFTLMPGDRVVVDKRAYGLRLPFSAWKILQGDPVGRGEVVIFNSPASGTRLIKRVVAVGGDRVAIQSGRLYVNGVAASQRGEPAVEELGNARYALNLSHGGGPDIHVVVPPGQILAVGDHRGNSLDGRTFGFVPEEAVYGRAISVYYRRGGGFRWTPL